MDRLRWNRRRRSTGRASLARAPVVLAAVVVALATLAAPARADDNPPVSATAATPADLTPSDDNEPLLVRVNFGPERDALIAVAVFGAVTAVMLIRRRVASRTG